MRYLIAHVRGADFPILRRHGFITFFPELDDYVFLEDRPENQSLTRKQLELGIHFLTKNGEFLSVNEEELGKMRHSTTDRIDAGSEILVVEGYCAGLEGDVLSRTEEKLHCRLKGYNRTYDVSLDSLEVVLKKDGAKQRTNHEADDPVD